ncbi:MAG: hypothetical protein HWN65_21385 [Candidatus Helarchaeota archaeon]|nr:hypothetical protein [Candidatus Helarchaeota archaeon]
MAKFTRSYLILCVLFLIPLVGSFTLIPNGQVPTVLNPPQAGTFDAGESTNPASPDPISEGAALSQDYASGNSYYYETQSNPKSGHYYVSWLKPKQNMDCDLYLYTDQFVSPPVSSSTTTGDGVLEWVVFRPSSSANPYYMRVATVSGSGQPNYLAWEESVSISAGTPATGTIADAGSIDIFHANLLATSSYTFRLAVDPGSNLDLYLYYLAQGSTKNAGESTQASTTGGNGEDETIVGYSPGADGKFLLMVALAGNGGAYTLTLEETSGAISPQLWLYPVIFIPIFFGATFGYVGLLHLYRYLKNRG